MYQDPIQRTLVPAIQEAFKTLFDHDVKAEEVRFQSTRPEFEGDVTINVFPFLKATRKGPEQTAQAIGEHLQQVVDIVDRFNVVKGFLNIVIGDGYWSRYLADISDQKPLTFASTGKQVMVEYSSPNTNKPLHLGHLRNIFLGHSVSRILEATGNDVKKVQIINDRGIHICKSMLAWEMFGNGETPDSSGLKGDKLVGKYYVRFDQELKKEVAALTEAGTDPKEAEKQAPLMQEAQEMLRKWEAKDPEVRALWENLNGWVYDGFDQTYEKIGTSFDKLYYESDTSDLGREHVMNGLERGIFFRKDDGSIWVDLTDEGLDEKLLLRSDGTAVYMTQDIGTAILRFEDFPKLGKLIYTVGNEQDYHFKVLFLILKKLGYDWADELEHLSYGMVDLPEGKMKSREGTVVDADEIMDEMVATAKKNSDELGKTEGLSDDGAAALHHMVGMAALKYFLLKVDPKKRLLFDPKASIDLNGHTGPFIQYTHARISSLLVKAGRSGDQMITRSDVSLLSEEREVLKLLHQFPSVLAQASVELDPASIANHVYELAKSYNGFYQSIPPILQEEDGAIKNFRLRLSETSAATIKRAMWLLGIDVPERM